MKEAGPTPGLFFAARHVGRRRAVPTAAVALLILLAFPSMSLADGAGRGRLFVPGDHFDPGETLMISGTDLDPGAQLTLRLISGSTVAEVGRAIVADDRTLTATVVVPAAFPNGYSELTATDAGGATWSTFVLIGDRPEGPDARQSSDDRLVWSALFAGGLGIVAIAMLLYRRAGSRGTEAD